MRPPLSMGGRVSIVLSFLNSHSLTAFAPQLMQKYHVFVICQNTPSDIICLC